MPRKNSTNYHHPDEPNLLDLHKAMQYNDNGEPELRTHVHGISLDGNVIVDKVRVEVDSLHNTIDATHPVPVYYPSTPTVSIGTNGTVSLSTSTLNALENINATVSGTVDIGNWPSTQTVNGTVALDSATLTALENISATISGTVALDSTTLSALEHISIDNWPSTQTVNGTVTIQDGGNTITVDGTVNANVTFPSIYPVSKDTNSNSATNRIYVSMETDTVLADSNYYMNVARGLVDTHTPVFRSAYIPDTPSIETSVWVEGGIYPYATWTSASTLYIASSSTADTSLQIYIEGLDASYNAQTETVTTNATNGQTTVTTTKQYLRIHRATIVNNNANSANAGNIRFRITSAAGTVVAHMAPGFGVTKLSQYTVPAGFTAYILYGDVASFKSGAGNQGCRVKFMVRPYQGSFVVGTVALASNGLYRNDFTVPFKVTEKSDLDVRVLTDSSGAQVSASYEMILIPN